MRRQCDSYVTFLTKSADLQQAGNKTPG